MLVTVRAIIPLFDYVPVCFGGQSNVLGLDIDNNENGLRAILADLQKITVSFRPYSHVTILHTILR